MSETTATTPTQTETKVLQVCVSKPKVVNWNGNAVPTAIFKLPVSGKVRVSKLNLAGDEQADLTVHGGVDKAVYAYPIEQYDYWKRQGRDFEWSSFGENLTTSGFTEQNLCIGDHLKIGTAVFVVSQPRMPCFKLGIRLGDPTMIKTFYKSGMWGYYLGVVEEGELEAGDPIVRISEDADRITLAEVSQCFIDKDVTDEQIQRVLNSKLARQMKEHLAYGR